MAQDDIINRSITSLFKQARSMGGMVPMSGPQMRHFWEAQDQVLEEAEAFAQHWFNRRHRATHSAIDTAKVLSKNGISDPADSIRAMTEWQAKSAERIGEDMREWMDMCARCTSLVYASEVQAAEEAIKETAKAAGTGGSAAKSKKNG